MSYKPQKGSVAARVLPIMQAATVPMVSNDVALLLKKAGGKPIPISQVSQALFNLSEKGMVNRKKKPGKKKVFTYYPLKLPNPTAEPTVDNDIAPLKHQSSYFLIDIILDNKLDDLLKVFTTDELCRFIQELT